MRCRLQPLDSSLCGHYCLYYNHCKCLGLSRSNIVNNMPSAQWIKCSVPMLFDITDILTKCQNCQRKRILKKLFFKCNHVFGFILFRKCNHINCCTCFLCPVTIQNKKIIMLEIICLVHSG